MKNYEPLEVSLIMFTQDIVRTSSDDNIGNTPDGPDGWEDW